MATPMRIFISHSHQDTAFCQALVRALRDAGADVWYDEHNLGSGELMSVIQRELGIRPIFIVILSKHALASKWVIVRRAGRTRSMIATPPVSSCP